MYEALCTYNVPYTYLDICKQGFGSRCNNLYVHLKVKLSSSLKDMLCYSNNKPTAFVLISGTTFSSGIQKDNDKNII